MIFHEEIAIPVYFSILLSSEEEQQEKETLL